MAFLVEVVGDVGVDRGKFLQGLHLPEPEHRPLPSSEGQVTVLCSVVGMPTNGAVSPMRTRLWLTH